MSFIRKHLFYDGLEKSEYEIIKGELYERSRRKLVMYSQVLLLAFLVLYLCAFSISAIAAYRKLYLGMSVTGILFAVVLHTAAKKHQYVGLITKYILEIFILSFGIFLGIVTAPNSPAVAFVVLTAMLPLLIYDTIAQSLLVKIGMIGIYFLIAYPIKTPASLETDFVNLLSFTILSTLCVTILNNTQAKEVYLELYMQKEIEDQTATIRQQFKKIQTVSLQTISAFSRAIDAKDNYTNGHSYRVAQYSKMIAQRLGKTPDEQDIIYYIAAMHDVGKIGIPDAVINKPTRLTDEEYALIKQHTVIGYHILGGIDALPDIAVGAYMHHERYDGKGYPQGISGEEIPEIARIIAVADAYDAMTSNRPYRALMPQAEAAAQLRSGRGTQFCPVCTDAMLEIIREDTAYTLHE